MTKLDLNKCRYAADDGKQCKNRPRKGSYLCDKHIWHAEWDREVFRGVNDRFM